MTDLPHKYKVKTSAQAEGDVMVEGEGLPSLAINSPAQFGGPGNRWSPEMLLVAAMANCIVLSFRAIARASKFNWTHLSCELCLGFHEPLAAFLGISLSLLDAQTELL